MRRVIGLSVTGMVLILFVLITAPQASSEVLSRFHSHGAHAVIAWEDGPIFGILSVSQDGRSANRPQTFLLYEIWAQGAPLESGSGYIRNDALRGSSSQQLALSVDTGGSALPSFERLVGAGGPINVLWTRDPAGFEQGSSGTSWARFGDFMTRTTGNSVFFSASATGSVMGFAVGGTIFECTIGRLNNATIEIVRGK